jgi:branched-chain amino acid transport system permease protein
VELIVQTFISGLGQSAVFLMLSVGLALLFGVMRILNFAHGDLMTLAAYIGYSVVGLGLGLAPALVAMLAVMAAVGAVFHFAVLRPSGRRMEDLQVVATFGAGVAIQGLISIIWGPNPVAVEQDVSAIHWGGILITTATVRNVVIAAVSFAVLLVILTKTPLGRQIRAVSQDPVAAQLMGVNTKAVTAITSVIGVMFAGVGGFFLLTTSSLSPTLGFSFVLYAFAIVVVAGMGSMTGAAIASLILGMASAYVALLAGSVYAGMVPFVAIILILIIRPSGLAGARR